MEFLQRGEKKGSYKLYWSFFSAIFLVKQKKRSSIQMGTLQKNSFLGPKVPRNLKYLYIFSFFQEKRPFKQKLFQLLFGSQNKTFSRKTKIVLVRRFRDQILLRQKFRNPTSRYNFAFVSLGCSIIKATENVFQTKWNNTTNFSSSFDCMVFPNQFAGATTVLYCAASYLLW